MLNKREKIGRYEVLSQCFEAVLDRAIWHAALNRQSDSEGATRENALEAVLNDIDAIFSGKSVEAGYYVFQQIAHEAYPDCISPAPVCFSLEDEKQKK